ncbi:MAG: radical SAM protein [Bacteroidales bacterium]|jgi:anaerobic magnesium-protoporphyrin IX monomethyl ester cyclase|nr:radical SAM protein [Bacteroidales bacterium]
MIHTKTNQILLLNPPGSKMYFRDYYCAKVSKAKYYYHPIDLVYLSGRLAEFGNIFVIDAIAEKLSKNECVNQVLNLNPNVIVFLSSAPSYAEDMTFIEAVKKELNHCKIIATGDVFRDFKENALTDNPFLNAILFDFSSDDILSYLKRTTNKIIPNIIYRSDNKLIIGKEKHGKGEWQVPTPQWEKFNLNAYHFPFAQRKPFASILTDFGCPYACDFCPVSTLGFKLRPIPDVIEELKKLKILGVKELYIRDQTFGVNKTRTHQLLDAMHESDLKFSFTALSRTDVLEDSLLIKMKKSGCHTLMIGIESANEEVLHKHKKTIKTSETYQSIKQIKKAGIKVGGFFMLGFPGETRDSVCATAKFARKLPIDYASFNIVSPRFGTEFRKNAIEMGIIETDHWETESSASKPIWKNQKFTNEELFKLKVKAVRKFYLRPSYILQRILTVRTWFEFKNLFDEGKALLIKNKKTK